MRCLNLKLQSPKLKKCRSYRTKRSLNSNNALRPNIVWGALCGYTLGGKDFFKIHPEFNTYIKYQ